MVDERVRSSGHRYLICLARSGGRYKVSGATARKEEKTASRRCFHVAPQRRARVSRAQRKPSAQITHGEPARGSRRERGPSACCWRSASLSMNLGRTRIRKGTPRRASGQTPCRCCMRSGAFCLPVLPSSASRPHRCPLDGNAIHLLEEGWRGRDARRKAWSRSLRGATELSWSSRTCCVDRLNSSLCRLCRKQCQRHGSG